MSSKQQKLPVQFLVSIEVTDAVDNGQLESIRFRAFPNCKRFFLNIF